MLVTVEPRKQRWHTFISTAHVGKESVNSKPLHWRTTCLQLLLPLPSTSCPSIHTKWPKASCWSQEKDGAGTVRLEKCTYEVWLWSLFSISFSNCPSTIPARLTLSLQFHLQVFLSPNTSPESPLGISPGTHILSNTNSGAILIGAMPKRNSRVKKCWETSQQH